MSNGEKATLKKVAFLFGFFYGYLYYAIEGILFGDKMYINKGSTKFDKKWGGIETIICKYYTKNMLYYEGGTLVWIF